jgi:AraC-like DNA-binding protein
MPNLKIREYKIPKAERQFLRVKEEYLPWFYDHLHLHQELQLMWIIQGEGSFMMGDNIGRFYPGDIFLIGGNTPHVFRSDEQYYLEKDKNAVHSISIFFDRMDAGEAFWSLKEVAMVNSFLIHLDACSYKLEDGVAEEIKKMIRTIMEAENLDKLLIFLKLLRYLGNSKGMQLLSHGRGLKFTNTATDNRLNNVIKYCFENYSKHINLAEAAHISSMSKEVFCRYFKRHTSKSFIAFLSEIRIINAAKKLLSTDMQINEIAWSVGFSNISQFNRVFKKIIAKTPKEYRSEGKKISIS